MNYFAEQYFPSVTIKCILNTDSKEISYNTGIRMYRILQFMSGKISSPEIQYSSLRQDEVILLLRVRDIVFYPAYFAAANGDIEKLLLERITVIPEIKSTTIMF